MQPARATSSAKPAANLVELIERAAESSRGVAFVDRRQRRRRFSWRELLERARESAGGLRALGIGRRRPDLAGPEAAGERVALVYPTGAEFFEAFFAVLLAGGVPVPLYPPVRLGRLDEYHRMTAAMIRSARAELMLCDRRVGRLLGETAALARPRLGCLILDELPPGVDGGRQLRSDEIAMLQFSSGTTVAPKPVALSHRAIVHHVRTINAFWPPETDPKAVSWLPLYHDMGLIGLVFGAIERPADLTLIPPELFVANPAVWLRAISADGATVSAAPNFAYGLCAARIEDGELDGVDLSTWTYALNGAETVSPDTARAFAERFAPWGFRAEAMTPVYGLSEATLGVTFSAPGAGLRTRTFAREALTREGRAVPDRRGRELVSLGGALPGSAIQIRSETGEAVVDGRLGRVWASGPSLMTGYFGLRGKTAEALEDGWLDTGDLGFVYDGELYLTGRAKDVVIVRGRNHAPEDLEAAVDGLVGARSGCSAALGIVGDDGAEETVLLVERARGRRRDVSDQALVRSCRERVLARTGVLLDRVLLLEPGTLPRTSSGKIRRSEARRRLERGALLPAAPPSPWRMLGHLVASHRAHRSARRAARRVASGEAVGPPSSAGTGDRASDA